MKKYFPILLAFCCFTAFGQKLDSTQINGVKYYIYPYPQEAKMSPKLENIVFKDFKSIIRLTNSELSKKQIKALVKQYDNIYGLQRTYKIDKNVLALVKSNSDRFYQTNYMFGKDIVPSLDKLPDGAYVQYFNNYYVFDKKGELIPDSNHVAGYFTLKNNLLEGKAYWLSVIGDTVKQGSFQSGLKNGIWKNSTHQHKTYRTKKDLQIFLNSKLIYKTEKTTFAKGIENGKHEEYRGNDLLVKGNFKDGKKAGEWFIYNKISNYNGTEIKDTIILKYHYTLAENAKLSHQPFVRSNTPNFNNLPYRFYNFSTYYESPAIDFTSFRTFDNQQAKNIELPEEEINGYEGEVYQDIAEDVVVSMEGEAFEGLNERYLDDYGYSASSDNYVEINGAYLTKAKAINDIGYFNKYDGVYEAFFDNGQLKIQLEFKDGNLVKEDTLFWDNGLPANVITYNPMKKEYESTSYDYKGIPYEINVFDSTGTFTKQTLDPFYKDKNILIENLNTSMVEDFLYSIYDDDLQEWNYFKYNGYDTLSSKNLKGNMILYKEWYPDSTAWNEEIYNADEKSLKAEIWSLNGTKMESTTYEFNDEFSNVRGKKESYFKDLKLINTFNGNYVQSFLSNDSIPQLNILDIKNSFEMTNEEVLYYQNQPFNGKVEVNFNARAQKFSVNKNNIKFNFSQKEKFRALITEYKKTKNKKETGKSKYNDIFSISNRLSLDYQESLLALLPNLKNTANYFAGVQNSISKMVGNIKNGKANGTWLAYDYGGNLIKEINFLNGELEGKTKEYALAFPKPKGKELEYDFSFNQNAFDTLPSKTTYYLFSEENYKNGIRNGMESTYDWMGNKTSETIFVDGFPEGPAFETNRIATTRSTYENGALDGIVKTYLHLPKQDTILLYELNFQEGALQGESKSYHTNGKLSKRGFFLYGQPIDDYESYDSLGMKYHYIKFEYSYPIEEKIWESNQLSVRYLYDWRDSIYFMPDDIVQTNSVENLLYRFGLLDNAYNQPYYGRPSLIEKTGVDYHMTKYFPNDTISRDGEISSGKKVGCWQFFSYEGEKLYEIEYFDSILKLNDSIQFKSKGILYDFDSKGNLISKSFIIEKFEKYDCSHTDHYEVRQFYTIWESDPQTNRMNGYTKNYYDNGTIQSEGTMKNGLPEGIWKYYDPFGKLNHVGEYVLGKRDGRWLSGDLSKTKYLGDICMNPNLPDLEEQVKYQEKLIDINIRYFKMGTLLNSEFYDVNLNDFDTQKEDTDKSNTDTEEEIEVGE